ncbi:MAG TPA: hypothetical protein VFB04_07700 [Terriglobales bacterium]|nr:hypothetical protein [Terriglobales bacterium]
MSGLELFLDHVPQNLSEELCRGLALLPGQFGQALLQVRLDPKTQDVIESKIIVSFHSPVCGHNRNTLSSPKKLFTSGPIVATFVPRMKNGENTLTESSNKKTLLKARCSVGLKARLQHLARIHESDVSTVVRDACRFYLARHENGSFAASNGQRCADKAPLLV